MAEPKLNILVVDDDALILETVRMAFENAGFNCNAVHSPLAAIEMLRRAPVDVVVADLMMPEMSGLRLQREIVPLHKGKPFVLMTGAAKELGVDEEVLRKIGCHVLYKPVPPDTLISTVLTLSGKA